MLNQQKWNAARFHQELVDFVNPAPGEHILDAGCGSGASLGPLLKAVGNVGLIVGLDRSDDDLREAGRRHNLAIRDRTLTLLLGDVVPLPFPDEMFDAIICQNVIECLNDREAFIAETIRVLKPGGRVLIGHHDFDGIILSSNDRCLTRKLVQGFAGQKQDWLITLDGQMGRMLPGLVAGIGFVSVEVRATLFVDLDLDEGSYARDYLKWLIDVAPSLGIGQEAANIWLSSQQAAAAEGCFFFGLPWIGVICKKPAV